MLALPERTRVPFPVFARLPVPVIFPERVEVSDKTTIVSAPVKLMVLPKVVVDPRESVVDAAIERAPVPIEPFTASDNMPAFKFVPPE